MKRFVFGRSGVCAAALLASITFAVPARAVIVLGGRDSTGALNNSGQNNNQAPNAHPALNLSLTVDSLNTFVGTWGDYLGTPIGPQYFLTANHIGNGGGANAGVFTYSDGGATPATYSATLAGTQDDLALWKISSGPAFTHYSTLYTGSNEAGLSMISLGRGTLRGSVVNTPSTSTPAGWNWGADPTRPITWGANTVGTPAPIDKPPAGFAGDYLPWAFNNNANPDTGILSNGDSGGPTFVLDPVTNQYELAGINSLVDQVSTQSDPNGNFLLNAGLYDARGFYDGTNLLGGASAIPLTSYSTRISSRLSLFNGVVLPEPGIATMILGAAMLFFRRRRSLR